MYFFSAEQVLNKIVITSNTHWSCNVTGNCLLSKNSGIGNDEITILSQKELPYTTGQVTFSYGDERCDYPSIDVYLLNDCYIKTIPSYSICEKGNILVMPFYKPKEMITVKVMSNGNWIINKKVNCNTVTNNDELVIIPNTTISFSINEIVPCFSSPAAYASE